MTKEPQKPDKTPKQPELSEKDLEKVSGGSSSTSDGTVIQKHIDKSSPKLYE